MNKQFQNLDEVVEDPIFRQSLETHLNSLILKRSKRPYRYYRRDVYDQMEDEGQIDVHFFLDSIVSIWQKTSHLPAQTRSLVNQLCGLALKDMIQYYESLPEPQPQPQLQVEEAPE